MNRYHLSSLGFLLFFFLCAPLAEAAVQPSNVALENTRTTSHFLSPAAEQLSQQIQTLVTPPPANPDVDNTDDPSSDVAPNFGMRAITLVMAVLDLVRSQSVVFITNFSALPQLTVWFDQQKLDPRLHIRWDSIENDFLTIVCPTALAVLLMDVLLLPTRRKLINRQAHSFSSRAAVLLILFLLRALPILFFIAASVALLDSNEEHKFPRFFILNLVYALSLSRIIIAIFRGLMAPNASSLRLFPLTTRQAVYGYRWLSIFSLLIIFGYFTIYMARVLRLPDSSTVAFTDILGLLLVVLTIKVIVQIRAYVASLLKANLPKASQDRSWTQNLRLWLSRYWGTLAIMYLTIGYIITALNVQNGFLVMLRGTLLSLAIIVVVRLLFRTINGWGRHGTSGTPLHREVVRFILRFLVWAIAFSAGAMSWGTDVMALFATPFGQRVSGSLFSIVVTTLTLAMAYELLSNVIDRHIGRKHEDNVSFYASARTRTLLPMFRNTVFFIFAAIAVIVALSEAGFNIAPLLAGAGVVGVAIGFGSQTLVKDFLTGLFIVAENTIAIGDIVKIGEHTGSVEAMSIRTLRLRDQDGCLHILPFSEVTNIVNMSRNFAYAVIKVGVAYDTDLEYAMDVMRIVGNELQADPAYKQLILDPIEIIGVDNLGDYAITLCARLRTRPGKQWDVKRRYLLRIKQRFDALGIELPFPTTVQIPRPVKA